MRYHSISEVMATTDLPSSLQSWLGHQLDSRGIDANIYSRYVLSILQQGINDPGEAVIGQSKPLMQSKKSVESVSSAANVAAIHSKVKSRTKKGEMKKSTELSLDEIRKMAAIECLLSVTEEASGIESLVEELILKLKEIQNEEDRSSPKKVLQEIQLQKVKDNSHPGEDPAQKYYAAFPSLSDKCDELKPKPQITTESMAWARVASNSDADKAETDTSEEDSATSPITTGERNKDKTQRRSQYRKHIKSPPKEEKERKNLESKQQSKLYRDSGSDSGGGRSNKKKYSPRSRNSPSSRTNTVNSLRYTYTKPGNNRPLHTAVQGKALFNNKSASRDNNNDTTPPPLTNKFQSRRSFPEFHPPSFIVPKVTTPKKCVAKYGGSVGIGGTGVVVEEGGEERGEGERCRSEEKNGSRRPLYFYRCQSDCAYKEDADSFLFGGDLADQQQHSKRMKSHKHSSLLEAELECLMASVEDLVWYTKPIDDIIHNILLPSPIPKQRLYERNASETEEDFCSVSSPPPPLQKQQQGLSSSGLFEWNIFEVGETDATFDTKNEIDEIPKKENNSKSEYRSYIYDVDDLVPNSVASFTQGLYERHTSEVATTFPQGCITCTGYPVVIASTEEINPASNLEEDGINHHLVSEMSDIEVNPKYCGGFEEDYTAAKDGDNTIDIMLEDGNFFSDEGNELTEVYGSCSPMEEFEFPVFKPVVHSQKCDDENGNNFMWKFEIGSLFNEVQTSSQGFEYLPEYKANLQKGEQFVRSDDDKLAWETGEEEKQKVQQKNNNSGPFSSDRSSNLVFKESNENSSNLPLYKENVMQHKDKSSHDQLMNHETCSELVFKDDYFNTVSRESSYGNIQDALGYGGFGYVPPNTPVQLKERGSSSLGLWALIELAEQMKTLSQDSDLEGTLRCISQEEQSEQDHHVQTGMETSPLPVDFINLFQGMCGGVEHECDDGGIPTPLSTCSPELNVKDQHCHGSESYRSSSSPAYCLSDDEGINQQNDLSAIASDDEIKPENIIKTKYSSITTELISTTGGEDKTQENEFDDSGMVDECSLMQYSGKFGQQEGLSNFLANSHINSPARADSTEVEVDCGFKSVDDFDHVLLLTQLNLDSSSGTESSGENVEIEFVPKCTTCTEDVSLMDVNGVIPNPCVNNNIITSSQIDLDVDAIEATQYSMERSPQYDDLAEMKTCTSLSSLFWWDLLGKPSIWAYDSHLANTVKYNYDVSSSFWQDAHIGSLWGDTSMSLTTTNTTTPSPVWGTEKHIGAREDGGTLTFTAAAASRPSPLLREFFSPMFQQESPIWDINMQRLDFSSSPHHHQSSSPPALYSQLTFNAKGLHMTFIEGGLYGTEWDQVLNTVDTNTDHISHILTHPFPKIPPCKLHPSLLPPNQSINSNDGWFPEKSLPETVSDTSTDRSLNAVNTRQRSPSEEYYSPTLENLPPFRADLFPSENSAFTDVSRSEYSGSEYSASTSPVFMSSENVPLHHVQSEPILSPKRLDTTAHPNQTSEWSPGEACYRMIQVKHLYKSDTSILRQLGLASGTDAEETDQSDAIEYSPDRHFVPIKTPQGSFELVMTASPTETISDTVTIIPEDMLIEKGSLEGSWSGSFKSASRSSSYQLYKDKDPEEEEEQPYFIPRFKVEKKYEKCQQTGDSPQIAATLHTCPTPIQEEQEEAEHERSLTERLLTDMKRVLELEEEECGNKHTQLTLTELHDSIQDAGVGYGGDDGCAGGESDVDAVTSGDDYPGSVINIATLWEEPGEGGGVRSVSGSIWSCGGLDTRIPLLCSTTTTLDTPSAIGTSEQQLEISAINRQDSADDLLDVYAAAIDNFEDYIYQDYTTSENVPTEQYYQHTWSVAPHENPTGDIQSSELPAQPEAHWSYDQYPKDMHSWATANETTQHSAWLHDEQLDDISWANETGHALVQENHPDVASWSHDQQQSVNWLSGHGHLYYSDSGSGQEVEPEWMVDHLSDDPFIDSDDLMFVMEPSTGLPPHPPPPPPLPKSLGPYSSDLENQWLSDTFFQAEDGTNSIHDHQAISRQKGRKKSHEQASRKPCSFFLEGSCRRTDCKFAHDMSVITCKFWEDGECFKGITCPFLHGYQKRKIHSSPHIKQHHIRPQKTEFKLEKSDFPELLTKSQEQEESSDQSTSSSGSGNDNSSCTQKRKSRRSSLQQVKSSTLSKLASTECTMLDDNISDSLSSAVTMKAFSLKEGTNSDDNKPERSARSLWNSFKHSDGNKSKSLLDDKINKSTLKKVKSDIISIKISKNNNKASSIVKKLENKGEKILSSNKDSTCTTNKDRKRKFSKTKARSLPIDIQFKT